MDGEKMYGTYEEIIHFYCAVTLCRFCFVFDKSLSNCCVLRFLRCPILWYLVEITPKWKYLLWFENLNILLLIFQWQIDTRFHLNIHFYLVNLSHKFCFFKAAYVVIFLLKQNIYINVKNCNNIIWRKVT